MKAISLLASLILVLMGVFHITMTDDNYDLGSSESLWFIGSGLLLIASGLSSFTAIKSCDRDSLIAAGIVNLGGIGLAIMAIRWINGAHTYLLLALFVICLIGVLYRLIPRQS